MSAPWRGWRCGGGSVTRARLRPIRRAVLSAWRLNLLASVASTSETLRITYVLGASNAVWNAVCDLFYHPHSILLNSTKNFIIARITSNWWDDTKVVSCKWMGLFSLVSHLTIFSCKPANCMNQETFKKTRSYSSGSDELLGDEVPTSLDKSLNEIRKGQRSEKTRRSR